MVGELLMEYLKLVGPEQILPMHKELLDRCVQVTQNEASLTLSRSFCMYGLMVEDAGDVDLAGYTDVIAATLRVLESDFGMRSGEMNAEGQDMLQLESLLFCISRIVSVRGEHMGVAELSRLFWTTIALLHIPTTTVTMLEKSVQLLELVIVLLERKGKFNLPPASPASVPASGDAGACGVVGTALLHECEPEVLRLLESASGLNFQHHFDIAIAATLLRGVVRQQTRNSCLGILKLFTHVEMSRFQQGMPDGSNENRGSWAPSNTVGYIAVMLPLVADPGVAAFLLAGERSYAPDGVGMGSIVGG